MAKKMTVEIDPMVVQMKVEMDNLLEDIKDVDYAIAELGDLFKVKAEQLKRRFEDKEYNLVLKKEKLQEQLRFLFEQVPQNETKTQRKVKLLNGDVVVKKAKGDFEKDAQKLLEWAEANNRSDLITTKEVQSFKWADFKKSLVVTESGIVDGETGETLEIEGLVPIIKPEELEVKYSNRQ